jgi:multiple sugar transport system substrate-binding protein
MNIRRARFSLLLLATLTLAACTGLGGADDADDELIWAIGGTGADPGGYHQQVAELWNEQDPDLPVRIERLPESADDQRQQLSLELNAEGDTFDILGLDVIWTGEFSDNGWLESLEDQRSEYEQGILEGPFESATWGGELWAAPYMTNAGFLYYRTDLVDEAPTTWDELKEVGMAAAEQAGISAYVAQGAQYEGLVVNYLEYYWSAGGELFNDDQTEVLFDEELAAEALSFMQESLDDGFYAPGFNTMQEDDGRNEFQSGNAVFMRNWPYAFELMSDPEESEVADDFAIAPLPTFTGEGTVSTLGGYNNAVSAYSQNVDAAREFVLWAATDEQAQRLLAETGPPPVLASTYDELSDDVQIATLGEILPDARPRPPAPNWNDISVEFQQEIFPAYNGDGDVQETVASLREYLETTLSD